MCDACLCMVGYQYTLSGGTCRECGYSASSNDKRKTTYLGKEDGIHMFRVHNFSCKGCGIKITQNWILCADEQIDVTVEFESLYAER